MNSAKKPKSFPQLGGAYSWFVRFLVLSLACSAAGVWRVSGALSKDSRAVTLLIVAGAVLCLAAFAAVRLRRRILQVRHWADDFMGVLLRAHERANFAEDRAKRLEQEREVLTAERNKLLLRAAAYQSDPD